LWYDRLAPVQAYHRVHRPRAAVDLQEVVCRGGLGIDWAGSSTCSILENTSPANAAFYFPVDGSPFELAIVHRDTCRTLCRFVGDEWSEADHLLEGESWILPTLGGLPCAFLYMRRWCARWHTDSRIVDDRQLRR
jgi:hypothetical protein